ARSRNPTETAPAQNCPPIRSWSGVAVHRTPRGYPDERAPPLHIGNWGEMAGETRMTTAQHARQIPCKYYRLFHRGLRVSHNPQEYLRCVGRLRLLRRWNWR